MSSLLKNFLASESINPYRFVMFGDAIGNTCKMANGNQARIFGVSSELPAEKNERVDIVVGNIGLVEAGAPIAPGAELTSDAIGRAITVPPNTNSRVSCIALENATQAGDVISVFLHVSTNNNSTESRPKVSATLGRVYGASTEFNDGTNTELVSRNVHATGRAGVTDIQFGIANFVVNGVAPYGEQPTGGATTWSLALELADGTVIPCTFGGNASITLQPGSSLVYSDPLSVYIPPGTTFFTRSYVRVSATNYVISAPQNVTISGLQRARKGTNMSAQFLVAGEPASGTTCKQMPPIAIIGKCDRPQISLMYMGDSIGAGTTGDINTETPHGETSFIGRACVNVNGFNIPHSNCARGGELLTWYEAPAVGYRRASVLKYATHFLCQAGTNDMVSSHGFTVEQLKARYLSVWRHAKANGCYVMQTTILPRVNNIATTQDPYPNFEPNGASLRDQINAWFFTQVGNGFLDELIDIRPAVEDLSNPGKWKNGVTDAADGVHPTPVANARIAADHLKPVFARIDAGL